jgi:hypothetical protein
VPVFSCWLAPESFPSIFLAVAFFAAGESKACDHRPGAVQSSSNHVEIALDNPFRCSYDSQ